MAKCLDTLRQGDLFGHPIMLHYNHRGPKHQTICGGICSHLVRLLILIYTIALFKKMVMHEDDKNSSIESLI